VLINIIGCGDISLDEVTQISDIIHDAAGDDAEIIFGTGYDPSMEGEVRVTVIATGFDRAVTGEPIVRPVSAPGVLPISSRRPQPAGAPAPASVSSSPTPAPSPSPRNGGRSAGAADVSDMEIPTFIRRQMD